jgi:hypothetical protein
VRKIRKQANATATSTPPEPRSRLRVLTGRAGTAAAAARDGVVRRAQSRVASGYYERPGIRQRLVDRLWEELFES